VYKFDLEGAIQRARAAKVANPANFDGRLATLAELAGEQVQFEKLSAAEVASIEAMDLRAAFKELHSLLNDLPETSLKIVALSPPAYFLAGRYHERAYRLFLRANNAITRSNHKNGRMAAIGT